MNKKPATNSKSAASKKNGKANSNHHPILSKREMDVLFGLANGLLYKEVAKEYGISIDTVKKHCKNIYRKLEARNRTEAIKNSGAFHIAPKKTRPTRKK